MYGPSAKKKKNGPCREVTVKGEEAVSSEVQLNITWYYLNFFWNLVSLKVQQTVLSNTVILTEINEAILLSIEGYCVCRDRHTVFRKLPYSRKLYLSMNSASRIFSSASFLSLYEVQSINFGVQVVMLVMLVKPADTSPHECASTYFQTGLRTFLNICRVQSFVEHPAHRIASRS